VNLPEKFKFRYRLLASADIIGSTAFKSNRAVEMEPWAPVFGNFFKEFPEVLASELNGLGPRLLGEEAPSQCLEVWKFVGDEILFSAELRRHQDAAYHAIAFKKALNAYSEGTLKRHGLGLKGTIWGAGFPIANVDVETRPPGSAGVRDFLGPAVDLGFRLAPTADARRIPLSVEVALFLIKAKDASSAAAKEVHLQVDPPAVLKGINAGRSYPMFWLDRMDGDRTAEDKLFNRSRAFDRDVMLEYIEKYFDSGTPGVHRPFIETDTNKYFTSIPEKTLQYRNRLIEVDADIGYAKATSASSRASIKKVLPAPPQRRRNRKPM